MNRSSGGSAVGMEAIEAWLAEPAFAFVYRPHATDEDVVEVMAGDAGTLERVSDIPIDTSQPPGRSAGHDLLVALPYRQITERGFACHDDQAPLLTMTVQRQGSLPMTEVLDRAARADVEIANAGFSMDDDDYAELVRTILSEEIGTGEGANFVIKRSFTATIQNYSADTAFEIFRRLLSRADGAYWVFLAHFGDRTFIGASPERHVSVQHGTLTMNPISGTHRYPEGGPTMEGVLSFLSDPKESDELYMVLDEELKIMGRLCQGGGRVSGPHLKEMASLAHTEYFLEGPCTADVRRVLRESMFAPTVTGSPVENACRVIKRHERAARGYYSGALALIGRDYEGATVLDSTILIRTAEVDQSGELDLGVGATLVRHSDPGSEVAETKAKAAGLLEALQGTPSAARSPRQRVGRFGMRRQVRSMLAARNDGLARFWLAPPTLRRLGGQPMGGRSALVLDNEDTFTAMLEHQLRALGLHVDTCRYDETWSLGDWDVVIVGPGPGDPRDHEHPKIRVMRRVTQWLLRHNRQFLAVCLGHQVLADTLGFETNRKATPNQGVRKQIDLFGRRENVGFYNTFVAHIDADEVFSAEIKATIAVSRDQATGEVHALRGPRFASMQFHPESILTEHGPRILADALRPAAWEWKLAS